MSEEQEKEVTALDGSILDKELFTKLFDEANTYAELPQMLQLVAFDVTRSNFDSIKEHSICYHISGMTDVIYGAAKALKTLKQEVKLLDIHLQDEMDKEEYKRFLMIDSNLLDNLND